MEYIRKSEWKLGLFIAGGIVFFGALVFTISNLSFFQKGYEIRVLFRFASGIDSGAPVRLAGVKVGEVKNIKIIYDPGDEVPAIELVLYIKEGVRMRQNADVLISTLGLLGEKYVEILPGTTEKPLLKNGDIIVGHDSVPLARIADLTYQIAQKLDQAIDAFREIFVKEEQKKDIKLTLRNISDLSSNMNDLVLNTDKIMQQINSGEGTMGKLIYDELLYREALDLVGEVKRNPWKLLRKTKEVKKDDPVSGNQGYFYQEDK